MSAEPLAEVKRTWERLANLDPLWAVLSEPDKKGGRWDLQEFLQTGVDEVAHVVATVTRLGLAKRDEVLDFGCGVGRLSIPLARHFHRVVGVDISPTMLEQARSLNPAPDRINFVANDAPDLAMFRDDRFDLVYSNIVLQHMDGPVARRYIEEFMRIVPAGAFVVFQLPSHLTEEYLPDGQQGTRLPDGAHLAEIGAVGCPRTMEAGAVVPLQLSVTNRSDIPWTQDLIHAKNVGNHWLDADGRMLRNDDGRVRLPGRLPSGQQCMLTLEVTAPAEAGRHVLEVDIVEEGVTWFKDRGSTTLKLVVDVKSGPTVRAAPLDYPTFKMEGVAKDEVVSLLGELGGEILHVEEHVTEWYSYKYFVRKGRIASRAAGY